MAELKTKPNESSVKDFIASISDPALRRDCQTLATMMKRLSRALPKMWGESVVGFGKYHYKYASGREGDWFRIGFSPRKQNLTIYVIDGLEKHQALLKKLGTYKAGKGCLYLKRLDDIDNGALEQLLRSSLEHLK